MPITKAGSVGEETLALHLRAHGIPFEREVKVCDGRRWRLDFLVAGSIAVEVNGGTWSGGRHSRGAGQASDYQKLNRCVLQGWKTLQYTTEQVLAGEAIDDVLEILRNCRDSVAKLPAASDGY
jgi:hypothetical protein